MRIQEPCLIGTFYSTTDAMAMETFCQRNGVGGRLIPVPSGISAGCGMCWKMPLDAREEMETAASSAGIRFQGMYACLEGVFYPVLQEP